MLGVMKVDYMAAETMTLESEDDNIQVNVACNYRDKLIVKLYCKNCSSKRPKQFVPKQRCIQKSKIYSMKFLKGGDPS